VVLYVLIEPLGGLGLGGLAQRLYWVVLLVWFTCTALWLRTAATEDLPVPAVSPSPV